MPDEHADRSRALSALLGQTNINGVTRRTIAKLVPTAFLSAGAAWGFFDDMEAAKGKKKGKGKKKKGKKSTCGVVAADGTCKICDGSCANSFPLCNHVQGCICVKTQSGTGCVSTSGGYCATAAGCSSCKTGDICQLEACGTCPQALACFPPCA